MSNSLEDIYPGRVGYVDLDGPESKGFDYPGLSVQLVPAEFDGVNAG